MGGMTTLRRLAHRWRGTTIRRDSDPADVRDILGMRTPAAYLLCGLFAVSIYSMAFAADDGIRHLWITGVAATIILGAGVGMLLAPGDPLPRRLAIPLAAAAPVGTTLALWQLPVPMVNSTQIWFLGAASAYLNFLCVRGAASWAWVAMVCQIATCVAWTTATGQGPLLGAGFSFINITPLLMATFFAKVVRPIAHSILSLRRQETERAAAEAAALAAQSERDARIARLDSAARPLLEIIARGRPLTPEQQQECRLVEAQLRDEIVGGLMVNPAVAAAARSARARGVRVVLDDGGGLDEACDTVRDTVRTVLRDALDYADGGEMNARVLPPGRTNVVSILLRDKDELRIDVSAAGVVRSDLDVPHVVSGGNQAP
ncbi:hypothetical protein AW168_04995 [Nocardia brasiliensis]|uniref:Membrane protein, putative coiled-coil domain protein n=2 Tax=Nocardia brasiliensis TaxID=37326 RepID=K0EVY6_NOCB7|nr:membrane protein, putative coiled-coil domain protein [Nocardia brasiliensis ATCC 700358]OCF91166.1 hypothetical protein AW168_04995 [Nocardia brasiliensis]